MASSCFQLYCAFSIPFLLLFLLLLFQGEWNGDLRKDKYVSASPLSQKLQLFKKEDEYFKIECWQLDTFNCQKELADKTEDAANHWFLTPGDSTFNLGRL